MTDTQVANVATNKPSKWDEFKALVDVGDGAAKIFNDNSLKLIFRKHIDKLDSSYIIDFLHKAQLSGADPRLDQIYLIPRFDRKKGGYVGSVVWSYHFFMSKAASHPDYDGASVTSELKEVYDPIKGEIIKELVSTATVYRKGNSKKMGDHV